MVKHYAAHVIAYGCTIFVPKYHFMLHIPKQLERFKFLVACWVHERKHRIIIRWAVHTDPHAIVERAIVEAVLAGCRIQACPKVVAALRESGFASAESADRLDCKSAWQIHSGRRCGAIYRRRPQRRLHRHSSWRSAFPCGAPRPSARWPVHGL